MIKFSDSLDENSKIKIIGIGGAGNNAINTMIQNNLSDVEFIAVNTDLQALDASLAENKIQIGKELVKGSGAGGNPEIGKLAAEENEDDLRRVILDAKVIFIAAGMGGGTGTGAAPIAAKIAKESHILTVAIVTYPFICEGKIRRDNADKGINELKNNVNSLIVVPNERLKEKFGEIELIEAFKKADAVLNNAVKSISDIINKRGYVNVDYADVKTVLSYMGYALIGFGRAKGENRAEKATLEAISNPLITNICLAESKAILYNITTGYDLKTSELDKVASIIHTEANENKNIIFGLVYDKEMKDKMDIAIIAGGIPESDAELLSIEQIKKKSHEDEISEIKQILVRIHQSEKISPYEQEGIYRTYSNKNERGNENRGYSNFYHDKEHN